MSKTQKIAAISSLRRESLNRKLARAPARLAPPEFTFYTKQMIAERG
jgi:hypothetical protein